MPGNLQTMLSHVPCIVGRANHVEEQTGVVATHNTHSLPRYGSIKEDKEGEDRAIPPAPPIRVIHGSLRRSQPKGQVAAAIAHTYSIAFIIFN